MSLLPNRAKQSGPESDMTPMVDVTFLLLIFFMVTAAFTMQRAMAVPKPDPPGTVVGQLPDPTEADIVVEVDEFNTYHVTTDAMIEEAPSEHDLVRTLRRIRSENVSGKPLNRMLVKADGEARHDKVVAALDCGAYVGVAEIRLLTLE